MMTLILIGHSSKWPFNRRRSNKFRAVADEERLFRLFSRRVTKAPSLRVIFLSLTNQTDNDHQAYGNLHATKNGMDRFPRAGERDCYRFKAKLTFFIVLLVFCT